MSRRSRKDGKTGMGWMVRVLIGLVVVGIVSLGIFFVGVRGYLHSDGFRQLLSRAVSKAARVEGEFSPFHWDGLAVDSSAFEARGNEVVKEVKFEGLHTEVGLGGLRRGVWEVCGSRVERLNVFLDVREKAEKGGNVSQNPEVADYVQIERNKEKKRESTLTRFGKRWLPRDIDVQRVEVNDIEVKALLKEGEASAKGMRVWVEPGDSQKSYRGEISGGFFKFPVKNLPEFRLNKAKLRWQDGVCFLSSLTGELWKEGRLEASGEWDSARKTYMVEGNVSGVKCEELFDETWAKRFVGVINSDFSVQNAAGPVVARGKLAIQNGSLMALPILDSLARYADTNRFRTLLLSEAQTDWCWRDGEVAFSNLLLASEGLIRLEGNLSIHGDILDGTFRLGLAPGLLKKIPGAETDVFVPGERGLLWTPLRVTGTRQDPKEDLTERLILAAGIRMLDTIPGIEKAQKVSEELKRVIPPEKMNKVMDQGLKELERHSDTVEKGINLLDGILGGRKR